MPIEQLRKNYGLTRLFISVFYVLAFAFAYWHDGVSAVLSLSMYDQLYASQIAACIFALLVGGTLLCLVTPLLTREITRQLRFHYLPRYEFGQVMVFIFAIKNTILGLLNLTYFITPVITLWGGIIFPMLATAASSLYLYYLASKHYLNAATAPRFFSILLVLYAVYNGISIIAGLFLTI